MHKDLLSVEDVSSEDLQVMLKLAAKMKRDRLDWHDRWMLVRPSNTEPIVRAIAEGETREAAEMLCVQAAECARSI